MRQYVEISIACADEEMGDIVTAFLADYPFETFDYETTETSYLVKAYILKEAWEECNEEALATIDEYGSVVSQREMEDENWNAAWEAESFEPVAIDDLFLIRAPHHAPASDGVIDIVVAPQMSFGSGHHQTTRMMCRLIHNIKPCGTTLDVGCGTGVLSIAALKCGATRVDAVDIDPWSTESTKSGAELNDLTQRMDIILGTVEAIEGRVYDLVLANINRNIILNDIERYYAALKTEGHLLVSGFLCEDVEAITEAAERLNLRKIASLEDEGWMALAFVK